MVDTQRPFKSEVARAFFYQHLYNKLMRPAVRDFLYPKEKTPMTLSFVGTLRYRFRLSLFGWEIFTGPWITDPVQFSEVLPTLTKSFPLVDGFELSGSETDGTLTLAATWEGVTLAHYTVPESGTTSVSLQPLKGVILSGTLSLTP